MTARPKRLVRAPSNIALIKYMGKSDSALNLPENPSLSMTLDALSTWVSFEVGSRGAADDGPRYRIAAGVPEGAPADARAPELSAGGRDKMLRHVERVIAACEGIFGELGIPYVAPASLTLKTANTFPAASGIASSASSFAAVTLGVALACAESSGPEGEAAFRRALDGDDLTLRRSLARVSRRGSGSSCRSFEGPWVEWDREDAYAVSAPAMPALAHFVLLISSDAKSVSSSEAHARVKTSPRWEQRGARVARRLELLRQALLDGDLVGLSRLAWTEAWEMHDLFHTSAEPFSYWKPATIETLEWLAGYVSPKSTAREYPPIVTLDAGPNIHVIVPLEDADLWRARFRERVGAEAVLEDRPGRGAEIVR